MEQLVRAARARAVMAVVLAVGMLAAGVLCLVLPLDGGAGGLLRVAGLSLVVGGLVALFLAPVNASLARQPHRTDARGAATVLVVASVLAWLWGLVLALLLGRPHEPAAAGVLLPHAVLFASLGLVAVATRHAAGQSERGSTEE